MLQIQYANQNQSTNIHESEGVTYITFRNLEEAGVIHGFSTRLGGVSKDHLGTMNLSFHRGDEQEAVFENHHRFAKAIGYDERKLVFSDQVHTTRIHKVTEADCGKGIIRESDIIGIDGLVTNVPEIPLITFCADCVPLFFYDPVKQVVALAHSGWRGTVARMGKVMVDYMQQEYGSQPEDILCAIGPSICQSCYEISEDVAEEFRKEFTAEQAEAMLRATGPGKYHLDLWKANQVILTEAGIREEHLEITDICTCCNPDFLFSHRASHGMRGNLGAVIMLK
ncbi:MAG: peptidoglycan editing factor PgeF [Lachnospiraceae bacterium]|nr:peptidoglycan editing factor PgeF [Lachnospiraceae bacterium]